MSGYALADKGWMMYIVGLTTAVFALTSYPAMNACFATCAEITYTDSAGPLGLEHMAELDPLKRRAGAISFVADRVDGLVGLGATGSGSHAPGETADLFGFGRQLKRAALLIERLSESR